MAQRIYLEGWNAGARKVSVPVETDGEPQIEDRWELGFIEIATGNRIMFVMNREVRDELVRQLTGGIVLAGGDLPRL